MKIGKRLKLIAARTIEFIKLDIVEVRREMSEHKREFKIVGIGLQLTLIAVCLIMFLTSFLGGGPAFKGFDGKSYYLSCGVPSVYADVSSNATANQTLPNGGIVKPEGGNGLPLPAPLGGGGGGGDTYSVNASSDDCVRRLDTAYFSLVAINMFAGAAAVENNRQMGSGMRFTNIDIPAHATILEAYLVFRCRSLTDGDVFRVRISAEDVDDAVTFANDAGVFDARWANRTTARVDWDGEEHWVAGNDYNSPDITEVIQEIADRPGRDRIFDMVIFWEDYEDRSTHALGCYRDAVSYDLDGNNTGKLVIDYVVYPPDCPDGLMGDIINIQEIMLSWNSANISSYYTVRGSYLSIPSDNESGYLIYTGSDNTCLVEGLDLNSTVYYFSLWNVAGDNVSMCLESIEIGGGDMEISVIFPVNYWVFGAGCIFLLAAVFFKKLLLYIALVPLWIGVIATAGNIYIDSAAGIVLLFAIIGMREAAKKQAAGGV